MEQPLERDDLLVLDTGPRQRSESPAVYRRSRYLISMVWRPSVSQTMLLRVR
jgi:hypothetical protein